MKLTYEQIRSITVGSLEVTQCDDGLHFNKCTAKQIEAFAKLHKDLGERAQKTTGVRLDFHTNSKKLAFSAPSGIKFEVAIDGLLVKQFDMKELREEGKRAEIALLSPLDKSENEEVRVTVHFPSHGETGILGEIELDDGATLVPHKFDRRILFIGDSITQGWNSRFDSFSFALRTSELLNAESVINGVGGAYFHETIFDSTPFDPDIVIVAYGTNDFGKFPTLEALAEQATKFFDKIENEYVKTGKKVFYISPITRSDHEKTKSMGSFSDCRSLLITESEKHGLIHIDGLSLVPPIFDAVFADVVHPNDLGFLFYAQELVKRINKYL